MKDKQQLKEARERADIGFIIILTICLVLLSLEIATIIPYSPFQPFLISVLATCLALIFGLVFWSAVNISSYIILLFKRRKQNAIHK